MKKAQIFLLLALVILTGSCAWAQASLGLTKWSVTLKVLGEDAMPVTNADACIVYTIPPKSSQNAHSFDQLGSAKIEGLTDSNGMFRVSHVSDAVTVAWGLRIDVQKQGYYSSSLKHELSLPDSADEQTIISNNNPRTTIVLKKIGNPIPMYARKLRIEIPNTNKPIGFDLIESDWVAPYGEGRHSDFVFNAERRWDSRKNFDSAMTLTFSNPSDGIFPVSVPIDQGCELRLPSIAPMNGYLPQITKHLSHTPDKGWIDDEREGNKEQNYYFRVRTVLDEKGNIKSALFGKIYDDFALDPINSKTMKIFFTYYLNPTPNDRNVEFDPKRNLSKNLKPLEGVDAP